jgi:hypothetical protein
MRPALLTIALVVACNGRHEATQPPLVDPPTAPTPKDAAMTSSLLHPVTLAALDLDALVPAGDLREDTVDGTVSARIVTGPVRVAFSKGPGATLDQLKATLPGQLTFEPVADATLCGQPAKRLVATMVPPIGTGARRDPDGKPEYAAGGGAHTTFVAVATERAGVWIRAQWIVDSAKRDDHRADEDRFFSGVRCR